MKKEITVTLMQYIRDSYLKQEELRKTGSPRKKADLAQSLSGDKMHQGTAFTVDSISHLRFPFREPRLRQKNGKESRRT